MKLNFEKIYKKFKGEVPCPENCFCCCLNKAGVLDFLPEEHKYLCKKLPQAKKYIKHKKINGINYYYIKFPCPFLKNNKCSIREFRPFDCRTFPLDFCMFNNKIFTIVSSKRCPVIKMIKKQDIQKISKLIINVISKVDKKWVEAARIVGSCGNCKYKNICNIYNQRSCIFDKGW